MIQRLTISTDSSKEFIDITDKIEEVVGKTKTGEGICNILCAHTTCGLVTGENEEGLKRDMMAAIEKLKPPPPYHHAHDPDHAPSHILGTILGQTLTIPIENNRLILGTWQRIFLVELDGPRKREIIISVV